MDLARAVAPITLARERTLPVHEALRPLLPDGALVRGRSVGCEGVAATSLALALTAEATTAGAWLAVVDLPWLGVEAAAELGVPLERLVRVDPGPSVTGRRGPAWGDLLAAVLDGFEVVVTRVPERVDAGVVRRVQARAQARGSVVVLVGAGRMWSSDVVLRATSATWEGVADGHGHLRARRVAVEASGRRVPRPRHAELWCPGPDGSLALAAPAVSAVSAVSAVPVAPDVSVVAVAS
jgi:hypothetical protein